MLRVKGEQYQEVKKFPMIRTSKDLGGLGHFFNVQICYVEALYSD